MHARTSDVHENSRQRFRRYFRAMRGADPFPNASFTIVVNTSITVYRAGEWVLFLIRPRQNNGHSKHYRSDAVKSRRLNYFFYPKI